MDIEQAAPRLKNLLLELREFDVDIKWAPATIMAISDCLSRYPVLPTSCLGAINMVVEQEDLDWHVEDILFKDLFQVAIGKQCLLEVGVNMKQ